MPDCSHTVATRSITRAQYAPVNNAQVPGCLAGQSVGKYTVEGQRRGRVSCYVSGDDPTVVWTLDSDLVIGYAFAPDDALLGLYDWWRSIDSSAVPVITPRVPAPPTPRPTAAPTPRPTARPTPRATAKPTARPTPRPTPRPTRRPEPGGGCDRQSYPEVCIPHYPPDLDCGDIPYRYFKVRQPDPHGFDGSDNDGLGCESSN